MLSLLELDATRNYKKKFQQFLQKLLQPTVSFSTSIKTKWGSIKHSVEGDILYVNIVITSHIKCLIIFL